MGLRFTFFYPETFLLYIYLLISLFIYFFSKLDSLVYKYKNVRNREVVDRGKNEYSPTPCPAWTVPHPLIEHL